MEGETRTHNQITAARGPMGKKPARGFGFSLVFFVFVVVAPQAGSDLHLRIKQGCGPMLDRVWTRVWIRFAIHRRPHVP